MSFALQQSFKNDDIESSIQDKSTSLAVFAGLMLFMGWLFFFFLYMYNNALHYPKGVC